MMDILFVDDDQNILSGLRRQMRSDRTKWNCHFANSGQEALQKIPGSAIKVVITDLKMPGMPGLDLLKRVKDNWPHMTRVVLSGEVDGGVVLRALGYAHRLVSKPCSSEDLRELIDHVASVRQRIHSPAVESLVNRMTGLPTPSNTYKRLVEELRNEETDAHKLGEIISSDVSLSAKIMQIANSSYFAQATPAEDPVKATTLLGRDTIRAMVVSVGLFQSFDAKSITAVDLSELMEHSLRVQAHVTAIARAEGFAPDAVERAAMAGLVHDIGKLVLATNLPDLYQRSIDFAQRKNKPVYQMERSMMRSDHGGIGGYLLGLWGFNYHVVDAVATHVEPFSFHQTEAPSLGAMVRFAELQDNAATGTMDPALHAEEQAQFCSQWGTPKQEAWQRLGPTVSKAA